MKILRQQIFKSRIRNHNKNTLIANRDRFNLELQNSFNLLKETELNVQQLYTNIEKSVKSASSKIKQTKCKLKKLTSETIQLIEDRQEKRANVNSIEYRTLDRIVKRNIRKDIRSYNKNLVQVALERNSSLKIARKGISKGKSWITSMKDKTGVKHKDRGKILDVCTTFYKDLYSNATIEPPQPAPTYFCPEDIPPITEHEVHCALKKMKYSKSPGHDGISTETLKIGEPILLPHLSVLFNTILQTGMFPEKFCHAEIILLHKKGERADIGNYRPISLISHLYKAFIKVIENRVSGLLDKAQPPEQAGFRPERVVFFKAYVRYLP
ncbi:hypothetical protein NE865_13094 [Phthorimaea operculella]|nr:hypothetical protein NE865_13094 [Phthorimaea operculella]